MLRHVCCQCHELPDGAVDIIEIDIPKRTIHLKISDEEFAQRHAKMKAKMKAKGKQAWQPEARNRIVSAALRAYAALTTSAATGAVRDVSQVEK